MSSSDHHDDDHVRLDDLRDVTEAAEALDLAPEHMQAAIDRGEIVGRKVGGTWITTAQEIERYRRDQLGQLGLLTDDEPELTPMDAVGDDGQVFGG